MNLKTITAPTLEPVALAEAKLQCRVDVDMNDDDTLISGLITAAREEVERQAYYALLTQTLELVLDRWECVIRLPRPPAQSVTSISYRNSAGQTTVLASTDYVAALDGAPAAIVPAYGMSWPTAVLYPAEAIRVRYVCGWTTPAAVPQSLKQACLLLIGHWYANREGTSGMLMREVPYSVEALCRSYRADAKVWL